jgi:hypothetical protein
MIVCPDESWLQQVVHLGGKVVQELERFGLAELQETSQNLVVEDAQGLHDSWADR